VLSISRPRPGRPCTPKQVERDEAKGHCQFWDLVLVDARRATLHRIVSVADHLAGPEWSPDGRTVAYSTGKDISLASANGTTRRLRRTAGYTLSYFGWSPDGRHLGLVRLGNVGNPKTGLWTGVPVEIALLDIATGKVRTLMKAPKDV
jgi:WD40-like Beta Propeller Repeat